MTGSRHARAALLERAAEARSVEQCFAVAAQRMGRLVPFDASVWLATDPATSLPTAPTLIHNTGHIGGRPACSRVWELEFLAEDFNLYCDLARADTPAAGLSVATGDRPERSTRFRDYLSPNGFGDELRAVMRAGGRAWAMFSLFRAKGSPAFTREESALVAGMSEPLAATVRDLARPSPGDLAAASAAGPGLLLFDARGELVSLNDDARVWLEELAGNHDEQVDGIRMPIVALSTVMRALAIAEEREQGHARLRARGTSGRWLVCHASCLRSVDGEVGETALVIEPAKAAEIAPIIVEAYQLSVRERQTTELIAQGFSTSEIADRLHLSSYTVRDYVKAVFAKVGVSSRGELVAHLFAEHYAPIHLHPAGVTVL